MTSHSIPRLSCHIRVLKVKHQSVRVLEQYIAYPFVMGVILTLYTGNVPIIRFILDKKWCLITETSI